MGTQRWLTHRTGTWGHTGAWGHREQGHGDTREHGDMGTEARGHEGAQEQESIWDRRDVGTDMGTDRGQTRGHADGVPTSPRVPQPHR